LNWCAFLLYPTIECLYSIHEILLPSLLLLPLLHTIEASLSAIDSTISTISMNDTIHIENDCDTFTLYTLVLLSDSVIFTMMMMVIELIEVIKVIKVIRLMQLLLLLLQHCSKKTHSVSPIFLPVRTKLFFINKHTSTFNINIVATSQSHENTTAKQ